VGDGSATWEPGSESSLTDLECPNPLRQLRLVGSPVREGTRALRVSVSPQDVWSNGTVRCLLANYGDGVRAGDDVLFEFSLFVPRAGISENLIWELHQPASLYSLDGCGLAPLALVTDGGALTFRIATGDCVVGRGMTTFEPNLRIPGLDPYPRGQWIDLRLRIRFSESPDGIVEVWTRSPGADWPARPALARSGIPTMPYSSSAGVNGVELYEEIGLYPVTEDFRGSDSVYLDAYRRTPLSTGAGRAPYPLVLGLGTLLLLLAATVLARRRRGRRAPGS
jgi:hypothetical protein